MHILFSSSEPMIPISETDSVQRLESPEQEGVFPPWIFHFYWEVLSSSDPSSNTHTSLSFPFFHIAIIGIWTYTPGFQFIFTKFVSNFMDSRRFMATSVFASSECRTYLFCSLFQECHSKELCERSLPGPPFSRSILLPLALYSLSVQCMLNFSKPTYRAWTASTCADLLVSDRRWTIMCRPSRVRQTLNHNMQTISCQTDAEP